MAACLKMVLVKSATAVKDNMENDSNIKKAATSRIAASHTNCTLYVESALGRLQIYI